MAKSFARLRGRDYVLPKDVQEVFCLTVAHRLSWKAEVREGEIPALLVEILRAIPAPQLK
jgi:MoxR-like ATPase